MTIGPVEYIVVGFPGNKFTGEIAPELIALVQSGTVRVLDLIFIGKDDDGSVLAFEIDELEGSDAFDELAGEFGGLISPDDIEFVASKLEPGNSGRTAALGRRVGRPLRPGGAEFRWRAPRRCPHSPRTDRTRIRRTATGSLSQRQRSPHMMMRRRPIARAAVRTTAVVGTAAVVGGHMANKQAQAQAAQAPPAERPPPPPHPQKPRPTPSRS